MTPEALLEAVQARAVGAQNVTVEVLLDSKGRRRYSAFVWAHGGCPVGAALAAVASLKHTVDEVIAAIDSELAEPGCKCTGCRRARAEAVVPA